MFNATECARRAGQYAFGVDEARTAAALRQLADDIEAGKVALHSISTSSQATQEEFTIRELVIEVLEETPIMGPRVIRG
jgi:hypothetical protein